MSTAKNITRFGPTRGFILLLSIGLMAWGLFVLNPMVDTFNSADFYMALATMAREEVWGAAFLVSGAVTLYGVLKRNVDVIAIGSMLGFLLWAFLSLAYTLSENYVTPIITNAILALIHGWAWLSVKLEPQVITNKVIWNDDEVDALVELAEFRRQTKTKQSDLPLEDQ